jgi:hypothetical protein
MLTVNGIAVASLRFLAAWTGVWSAEVEIMSSATTTPSGRVVIASDGIALSGTVDPDKSGTFADKRHVRVLAGADGWRKPVRAQHYNSSIGVTLREVVTTTAAEVGEAALMLVEKTVGFDFVRSSAPGHTAAQVFVDAKVDWWVGLDGITRVGARPTLPAPTGLVVLDWRPESATVSFTCPVLVEPGTLLVDARFGRRVVRNVEAHIADGSVTGTLRVAEEGAPAGAKSELAAGIGAIAMSATKALYGRFFEYRVQRMSGVRVELEVIKASDGVPNLVPVSIWAGSPGVKATLREGARVLVGFRAGDAAQPFVGFFEAPDDDGWRPVELDIDAITKLALGATAAQTVIGPEEGALPAARMGDTVQAGPFAGVITKGSLIVKVGG